MKLWNDGTKKNCAHEKENGRVIPANDGTPTAETQFESKGLYSIMFYPPLSIILPPMSSPILYPNVKSPGNHAAHANEKIKYANV